MQVCTVVLGKAASIASPSPLSPSTTAMRMLTPRLFISLKTLSQNLAPSVCSIPMPSTSREPSGRIARARYTALLRTTVVADLHAQSIEEHHGIHRLEGRTALPCRDLLRHLVGYFADELGRDVRAVHLGKVALNL